MTWFEVQQRFRERERTLSQMQRAIVREFFCIGTSMNSCTIADFLDGSARYPVSESLLGEMSRLVQHRLVSRPMSMSTPEGSATLETRDDIWAAYVRATNREQARSTIQPRSRPQDRPAPAVEVVNVVLDSVPPMGLLFPRTESTPGVNAPVAPPQQAATNPEHERGRQINEAMGLRQGARVDVVNNVDGRFTRTMRYEVRECQRTGTLVLRPIRDAEPQEASLARLGRVRMAEPVEARQEPPEAPQMAVPRRRLRL